MSWLKGSLVSVLVVIGGVLCFQVYSKERELARSTQYLEHLTELERSLRDMVELFAPGSEIPPSEQQWSRALDSFRSRISGLEGLDESFPSPASELETIEAKISEIDVIIDGLRAESNLTESNRLDSQAQLYRLGQNAVEQNDRWTYRIHLRGSETSTSLKKLWLTFAILFLLPWVGVFVITVTRLRKSIARRQATERALLESEQKFQAIIENLTEVIIVIEMDGTISYISPSSLQLFEQESKEFIGKNIFKDPLCFNKSEHKRISKFLRNQTQNSIRDIEYSLTTPSGAEKWLFHSASLIQSDTKSPVIISTIHDVTKTRLIEEETRRHQKLESIGIFAGGIAHDFNNILQAIMGNLSLTKMDLDPDSDLLESLDQAENACMKARQLTQQLVTFARGGLPVKELISVKRIIADALTSALKDTEITCEPKIEEGLWNVQADVGQIKQVLINIIQNALQATAPKTTPIEVLANNKEVDTNEIPPLAPGPYLKITIKDYGTGIADKDLDHIFDPFFSTKGKRRGLGLATAYSVINKHDGHISVESAAGKGTSVHIYLRSIGRRLTTLSPAIKSPISSLSGRVLIMDDEEMVLSTSSKLLGSLGLDVTPATEGSEALEFYKTALARNNPFDLVVLDLTVPGGMGGKETMEKLLKIDPQVTAIVSSGYSDDPVMAQYWKYGFKGVAMKPYVLKELQEVIEKALVGRDDHPEESAE